MGRLPTGKTSENWRRKVRTLQQKQVEAETAIIRAGGEAEAIKVRGEALRLNPANWRRKAKGLKPSKQR
jgi:hypothetical protein